MKPKYTRLRYLKSKDANALVAFMQMLPRVQIYGAPVWTGKAWYLWFVPHDDGNDVPVVDIDKMK